MTVDNNKTGKAGFRRKITVLAAALVLLLSTGVVAYAAGWFTIRDAVIGSLEISESAAPKISTEWSETAEGSERADALCLLGIRGSAEYEATKEWFEYYWSESYESAAKGEEVKDNLYNQYGAFSKGAIDRLSGICEKYGLKPLDSSGMSSFMDIEVLYDAMGCEGLLKPGAGHSENQSGYYYDCGSFKLEGELTLTDGFDKPICYQLMNNQKGYFSNGGYVNIGSWEDYEQWDYTTEDGVTVTIVHSADRDILLSDLTNSVLAINIVDFAEYEAGRTKADMEAFAECFDFSVLNADTAASYG